MPCLGVGLQSLWELCSHVFLVFGMYLRYENVGKQNFEHSSPLFFVPTNPSPKDTDHKVISGLGSRDLSQG